MNKTRVVFFTFLFSALLITGLSALAIVRSERRPQIAYTADMSPTAPVPFSNATATPSLTPFPSCAWSWASRNEVEFAADLQEKLTQQAALADTIAIAVDAFSRGENCHTGQGTPRYGAMDTNISIMVRLTPGIVVNNLETAYTVLEPMTRAILQTLASYPRGTPSFQINLTVEFRASAIYGEGVYILSTDAQGYQSALEQGGDGIMFFEPLGGLYATPVIRVT